MIAFSWVKPNARFERLRRRTFWCVHVLFRRGNLLTVSADQQGPAIFPNHLANNGDARPTLNLDGDVAVLKTAANDRQMVAAYDLDARHHRSLDQRNS